MAVTAKKKRKRKCRVVKKKKLVDGKKQLVKVKKCKPRRKPKPKPGPTPTPAPVYPPPVITAPPIPPPPPPPRLKVIKSPIAVYGGAFGRKQAERLTWRAGFGPRPGQLDALVGMDLEAAVMAFTRPTGVAPLDGPEPTRDGTNPIELGRDEGAAVYWLDRMVRSRHQLVERLALVFHDWWATRRDGVANNAEMLEQVNVFRAHGLGSFRAMTRAMTGNAAMLRFLNGDRNRRGAVNENYGRELMELFTLGADRGAYTEDDVRQIARALTGWTTPQVDGVTVPRYDEEGRWDFSVKTVFGKSGRFTWEDACELVLTHPMHPSFFVRKLWGYFIPTPPSAAESKALEQLYVGSNLAIRPVLEAILCHPAFYEGPTMVKPPIVLSAGMLRAQERTVGTYNWHYVGDRSGQQLHFPPDVSGWNDVRWLDTNTTVGRWDLVREGLRGKVITGAARDTYPEETPDQALAAARAFWGGPSLSAETVAQLKAFAADAPITGTTTQMAQRRAQRFNALRQLVAASPDYQTC